MTDGWTDRRMDIGGCRVAFTTEKFIMTVNEDKPLHVQFTEGECYRRTKKRNINIDYIEEKE